MRKEDIRSTIILALMLVIVIIVGVTVIQPNFGNISSNLGSQGAIICVILSLLIGFIVNGTLIEIGHLLGALIGKYKIYHFCVLGFCFYKDKEGRLKFKLSSFDGIVGDTKIEPKSEKSNSIFYILFPLLFISIEVIVLVAVISIISNISSLAFLKYACIICLTIGGILVLYDYAPIKLDTYNDGYRYVVTSKKINKDAYNEYLRIIKNIYYHQDDLNYKTYDELTDFTSKINMLSIYRLVKEDKIQDGIDIMDKIINSNVSSLIKDDALMNNIYLTYLLKKDVKDLLNDVPESFKREISKCSTLLSSRAYIAELLGGENIDTELEFGKTRFNKIYKRYDDLFKDYEKELVSKIIDLENY